jgi:hypothetical protein
MIKIDWLAAVRKGAAVAKQIKNAGDSGDSGDKIRNTLEINDLTNNRSVPTGFSALGTVGTKTSRVDLIVPTVPSGALRMGTGLDDGNNLRKQTVSGIIPTLPSVPTAFDDTLEKSTATLVPGPSLQLPPRRRPWEIDPVGERQEEDGKFFRNLHRRACERAGLPAPVSPLEDDIIRKLENWRREDEESYRCWVRKPPLGAQTAVGE